jgi:Na+/melibiose symporter-like transporter
MVLTYVKVSESRDPDRPRSIDYAGTVLVALTLVPLILGVSKSGDWGWLSVATLSCFAISAVAGCVFLRVEQRVRVPLLDLRLLRNRVLVGSTLASLVWAGTINGLMYLLSLYFQDPAALGFSPLEAGLATLPATVGLVVVAPLVPRLADTLGWRQTIGLGFLISTVGFAWIGFTDASWNYGVFLLPIIAIAVGMGLSNGPSSSAATASVDEGQVGEASGVSNMARYVGAAVATALAATVYGTVIANHQGDGASTSDALSDGLGAASWVMTVLSALGIVLATVAIRHHRAVERTLEDAAAAAAAHLHTLPTGATLTNAGSTTQEGTS